MVAEGQRPGGEQPLLISLAPLVLASASPRRRYFLKQLGLDFEVAGADVDESHRPGESPEQFVRRLAHEKAAVVAARHPGAWVLGADTVVVLGAEILGKPADAAAARTMLRSLAGHWHRVWTGVSLCHGARGEHVELAISSEVRFAPLDSHMIDAYVATGEPLDKAGAYGIQGRGGCLVQEIRGSYSNIVGLPLTEVVAEMIRLGVARPATG